MRTTRGILVVWAILTALASAAGAQSTAFTYQGQLKDGGTPANGSYDFQFDLYDAVTGGTLLGTVNETLSVNVGVFTASLDYGSQFSGAGRWLEISVRPSGGGSYTPLAPRQPITPAPYSIGLALPFAGSADLSNDAFSVTNTSGAGVAGTNTNSSSVTNAGVVGTSTAADGNGVSGFADSGTSAYGVYGQATAGYGVYGSTSTGTGLYGYASGQSAPSQGAYGTNSYYGNYGALGTTAEGVYGWGNNNSIGVNGQTVAGTGLNGVGYNGAWGTSNSLNGNGLRGECSNGNNAYGVWGLSTTGWAGTFSGNAQVTGNFYGGAKFFRIDHPLHPESSYLIHSCVESNEMKNVYDGVATLDGSGEAWVQLPDWFESLNTSFRYQLTCIGQPALVYVKQKIMGNRFLIGGGQAGMEVSWQVTGVRQDAYARANPMQVEVAKQGSERGQYLHPAAFGQPEARSVQYDKLQAAHAARPETKARPPVNAGSKALDTKKND